MPVLLYRTSCDQRKTTRQIWTHVSEFGVVLRIQRTKLLFHKLAKLIIHARFLTTSQQRFRKLDVFLRLNQLLICWDTVFLKRVYSIPLFHTTHPCPALPWERGSKIPVPLDSCCHSGQGYLEVLYPRWLKVGSLWLSHARVSLNYNQLRISKVMLDSCPQNIKHF